MSQIKVTEAISRRDHARFINLPWRLYKKDPNWVAPLRQEMWQNMAPEHNALLRLGPHAHLLAWIDGRVVGRLAVGIDENLNSKKNKREGYISLFEAENDYAIAQALFDAAIDWLKERGITSVTGPQSPSNGDDYRGLLIQGFDSPPVLMNTYNPSYYADFFDRYGFAKFFDRLAFYYDLNQLPERFGRMVTKVQERYGFHVDKVDLSRLREEFADVKVILDNSWPQEWPDMVPPTLEEIQAEADRLLPVADADLIYIARSNQGQPIGVAVALPDYNQVLAKLNGRLFPIGWAKFLWLKRKITGARLFILMVDKDWHKKGVSAAIYHAVFRAAQSKGYTWGEGGTVHEFNRKMVQDAIGVGGKLYKVYRIYRKDWEDE